MLPSKGDSTVIDYGDYDEGLRRANCDEQNVAEHYRSCSTVFDGAKSKRAYDSVSNTAMLVLSRTGDGSGSVKKRFTFRLNEDGTNERISCGEYVDAMMTTFNASQECQRASMKRSPETVSNVPRADIRSVHVNFNVDRVRSAGGNEGTPELSENFIVLRRSQAV